MLMHQIYSATHSLIQQRLHDACISPTALSHIKLMQCMEPLLQPTCGTNKPSPPVWQRDDCFGDHTSRVPRHG